MITLEHVSVDRSDNNNSRKILDDLNVQITTSICVITGPSGAGKTSLVRLLNGLSAPSSGRVQVLGKWVDQWAPRELRRTVGYVAQQPVALTESTEKDLRLAVELAGSQWDQERIEQDFNALELPLTFLSQKVSELSVGERQRVAIIRGLVGEPQVLILDEPTSALDEARARSVHNLLRRRSEDGLKIVLIEHRTDLISIYDPETVQRLYLEEGRIVSS